MRPRRFLPSIGTLTAFEAVMRTGSVTAAAADLNLTQSTVSRLIQSLEAQTGRTLFERRRRRLVPTAAATAYAAHVSRALDLLQQASMGLVANPGGGTLSLAVLPTFGTRWLAPRLHGFFDANPGISINLSTRVRRFGFEAEAFDAAIFFGDADWEGARHLRLLDERYTACASPDFVAAQGITGPADVADRPRLLLESRPAAWADWFAGQDLAPPPIAGMIVDQFSMMIQAALEGLGVALLPAYLAEMETREGRLTAIGRPAVPAQGAYWLAWPDRNETLVPLAAFRDWLAGEAPD